MNEPILQFFDRAEVWGAGLSLAAFLTLFWIVRGAPLGQATPDEPEGAPSRGRRDRAAALAVAAVVTLGIGAYVALFVGIPWSLPVFAVGYGTLLLVIRKNEPYRHASPTLRRTVRFANAAISASVWAGILIVANVVAFRFGGDAIDFTRESAHSLSSQSRTLIGSLEKPLRFTVFLGKGDRSAPRLDRVWELLDLYRAANPGKITIESINPFTDLGEFENFVKRVPDAAILREGGVALEYGEGESATRGVVSTQELFQVEGQTVAATKDGVAAKFHGEDAITSALIRLRDGKTARVAFSTGHGEPSLDDMERNRPGLGYWRTRLASVGVQAIPVNLTAAEVPADVEVVVIVAPSTPFQPPEVERLKSFLVRGGRLLAILGLGDQSGLEELLRTHNIVLEKTHVFDPVFNLRGPSIVATPPVRPVAHPVVDAVQGQQVLVPNARPIDVLGQTKKRGEKPTPKANPGVDAMPLLFTGPDSFATDSPRYAKPDRAKDRFGPLIVGAAAMEMPQVAGQAVGKPLLMVFSSPYLADNQFLAAAPANLDLLMNSVNWLRRRPDLAGIAPKTHVSLFFTADPTLRARLHTIPTLVAGMIVVGVGALTYLTRRR